MQEGREIMPQNEQNQNQGQSQQPPQQPQWQPPPPNYGNYPMMPDDYGQPPKKKGGFDVSNILMIAVVAGVLAYAVMKIFAPSLSQYKADITRLENDLVNIRANYALVTNVPNVTALNTRIATVETSVNETKTAITTAQSELNAMIAALQTQIDNIPQFDATALQASINANGSAIDDILADLDAVKAQIGGIEPADLTDIETRLTALENSIVTINTSITALADSIETLTPTIPSIYISNFASSYSGLQAIITSNRTCYALVTIKYTFTATVPIATPMPSLTILPFGSLYLGNYVNDNGTNIMQCVWSARVLVNAGDNPVQWYPSASLATGTWSVSVEVSQ